MRTLNDQFRRFSILPLGLLEKFRENEEDDYQRNNRRKFPRTDRC